MAHRTPHAPRSARGDGQEPYWSEVVSAAMVRVVAPEVRCCVKIGFGIHLALPLCWVPLLAGVSKVVIDPAGCAVVASCSPIGPPASSFSSTPPAD